MVLLGLLAKTGLLWCINFVWHSSYILLHNIQMSNLCWSLLTLNLCTLCSDEKPEITAWNSVLSLLSRHTASRTYICPVWLTAFWYFILHFPQFSEVKGCACTWTSYTPFVILFLSYASIIGNSIKFMTHSMKHKIF